jgi:hypothetical protein
LEEREEINISIKMISVSLKRVRVRTLLCFVFLTFFLANMAWTPFTKSVVYASSVDTLQMSTNDSDPLSTDVIGDGVVNICDLVKAALAFGSYPGHPKWDPRADVNDDGVVNERDLEQITGDFEKRLLRYDFDEPLDWNVVSGTWSIQNGLLEGVSNAEGLIYTDDIVWGDCNLTAKVKIAADSPRAEAAFCVRLGDSGNSYWVGLGCWGHKVSISRIVDHVAEELIFSGDEADVVKDVWYSVSVKVSGSRIMLYVNDVLELVAYDSTFASGVVGVRSWNSHIFVDHVTVSGKPTLTKTEPEIYRGFACSGDDLMNERYTSEDFRRIKQWGFNTLLVEIWWTRDVEPYADRPFVYSEQRLQALERSISLAQAEGLNIILSGRVQHEPGVVSWDGWSTHDYVNLQEEGLNRYAKFWEMMVQRVTNCMYCLWHFPYHDQSADSMRRDRYYTVTFPTLLSAVRKHSNNKVIFVPIHQGATKNGETADYYLTASSIDDANIIYGLGHMMPWSVVDGGSWNYDVQRMDTAFSGIQRWTETFKLPMMSVEYSPIRWVRGEPIDESRLDCLEESLKRMGNYNVGWVYWRLSLTQTWGDNILDDINNFEPNTSILTIFRGGNEG